MVLRGAFKHTLTLPTMGIKGGLLNGQHKQVASTLGPPNEKGIALISKLVLYRFRPWLGPYVAKVQVTWQKGGTFLFAFGDNWARHPRFRKKQKGIVHVENT